MAQLTYRAIPAFLPKFLMGAEAKRSKAYLDGGGIWTIGIGHTGPEVVEGAIASDALIEYYLTEDLGIAVRKLYKVLTPAAILALSENQWGAIISFAFNCGAKAGWDIWSVINAGKLDEVPTELARFNKVRNPNTGKLEVNKGLVNRRAAETAMWSTPDPVDASHLENVPPPATSVIEQIDKADVLSSAVTRNLETPPTVQFAKHAGAQLWTGIGSAVTLGPPAIKHLLDTLNSWSVGNVGWLQHGIALLTGLGAALAVAAIVYGWLNHKAAH